MYDRVEMVFREDMFQRLVLTDIDFGQAIRVMARVIRYVCELDLRVVKFVEIIYNNDSGGPPRQQVIDQMAADETRATRNQKPLSLYIHD
jgi:hypothetical protein